MVNEWFADDQSLVFNDASNWLIMANSGNDLITIHDDYCNHWSTPFHDHYIPIVVG